MLLVGYSTGIVKAGLNFIDFPQARSWMNRSILLSMTASHPWSLAVDAAAQAFVRFCARNMAVRFQMQHVTDVVQTTPLYGRVDCCSVSSYGASVFNNDNARLSLQPLSFSVVIFVPLSFVLRAPDCCQSPALAMMGSVFANDPRPTGIQRRVFHDTNTGITG